MKSLRDSMSVPLPCLGCSLFFPIPFFRGFLLVLLFFLLVLFLFLPRCDKSCLPHGQAEAARAFSRACSCLQHRRTDTAADAASHCGGNGENVSRCRRQGHHIAALRRNKRMRLQTTRPLWRRTGWGPSAASGERRCIRSRALSSHTGCREDLCYGWKEKEKKEDERIRQRKRNEQRKFLRVRSVHKPRKLTSHPCPGRRRCWTRAVAPALRAGRLRHWQPGLWRSANNAQTRPHVRRRRQLQRRRSVVHDLG